MSTLLMFFSVTIGSLAQIPLKLSAKGRTISRISYFVNVYTIVGYAMMLVASVLSFIAIRGLQLKSAAIIETIGYINILIIGAAIFQERVTLRKVLACALIIAGILVFTG